MPVMKPLSPADKKEAKNIYFLLFVPFYMISIHVAFSGLYLLVFGNAADYGTLKLHPAYQIVNLSQILMLAFMLLQIYAWVRPAGRYVKEPSLDLRNTMRRRIERIYPHMAFFFSFSFLATVVFSYFFLNSRTPGFFLFEVLPAMFFSFLAQCAIALAYVDSMLYRMPKLMEALYDERELLELKAGYSIPVYIKVSLLVITCAVVPFIFLNLVMDRQIPPTVYEGLPTNLFIICTATLLVGLSFIFYGIQKPLNGLIERMKNLGKGKYSKTRIYFSDEVAQLKAGYNEMVDGLKEREELQDTFGKYMSIEIARELIQNKKINLGGEDIHAAVMFCDIRNFTPLSEKMGASELVEFLNQYFHYITPPISEYNGVINKFIGDAVMAVYTPLLGSSDYTADAVRSALGMRRALAEFNASGKAPAEVQFGIGIHCGRLVAGNVGTSERLEYTFIGDTVNVASRLESKTKDFGADIILSEAAMEKSKGSVGPAAAFQPLGKVALKGKSEPMELYKVA